MHIAVIADQHLMDYFNHEAALQVRQYSTPNTIDIPPDAIFYLLDEETLPGDVSILSGFQCPVIVNAVTTTLDALPLRFSRINAWPGFLQRTLKEVVASETDLDFLKKLYDLLGWQYRFVADQPGMIAARIIAMIINEAWFAYTDGVSSQEAINQAMKLGTNYPYGPFEWGNKIGLKKIATLLLRLSKEQVRYTPAPLLLKNVN